MVTPIRLYPLHCTLYCCTLTPTLTHQQSSALVALSPAFISDFCSVHSIGYNFHSTFRLRFHLEINSFSPNSVFCWKQRATTTLDFEHVFRCSQFSRCSFAQLTLFALAFFVGATFKPSDSCSVPNLPHFRQFAQSFALQWLPISIPRGTSAQETFGLCQLSLILKT